MRKPPPPATALAAPLPAVGEGRRGIDGHIGYLLRQAAAAQRLAMEHALADLGLTPPQFVVLTLLDAYPGLSNADLARLALLTPQTVSLIVTNLDKIGALSRRPHAVHGRIVHLDVTAVGHDLLATAKTRVSAVEARMVSGLDPADEAVVRRWLVAVAGLPPADAV